MTTEQASTHVVRLDHATINTADLEASLAFYAHFLGLRPGWRPPFDVGGAWLYAEGGDYPILHLIETQTSPSGGMFNHVAFRSVGLDAYLERAKAAGVSYTVSQVVETSLVQVQHHDPNGVLIEVNFDGEPLADSEVRT